MMRKVATTIVLFAAFLAACGGKSAADYQNEARAALEAGDTVKAIAVTTDALGQDAVKKDPAAAMRLEQIRLEALAKAGKGAEVKLELERVAGAYPKNVNASLYRSLADRVKAAGDTTGAIDILVAGDKRFPAEHASFSEAIDALKATGAVDPAQIERLRKLGYL
jgi:tetratricopeptide (TPR) repeat protein